MCLDMYNLHGVFMDAHEKLENSTARHTNANITLLSDNLRSAIKATTTNMMSSSLFHYTTGLWPITFNIRVAVDVLHKSNITDVFLSDLQLNIEQLSDHLPVLWSALSNALRWSSTESSTSSYQSMLSTVTKLNQSILLFPRICQRFNKFKYLVQNHKILMSGQNMANKQRLVR